MVTFRSKRFPPYDGEEEEINPGLWGKRLAEYLVQKLAAQGISTGKIAGEDWGWFIPIENDAFALALCCGHQGGDDDEFLCFIKPDKPVVRRWFRKIETSRDVGRLADALDRILTSDPEITEAKWEAAEEQ